MNENFHLVDRKRNPPNIPQARPIEKFWSCLVQKVYEKGWQATTQNE